MTTTMEDFEQDLSLPPTSPHNASEAPTSSGNTTVTLEINTDYTQAYRFPVWMALTVFSTICLAGLHSRKSLFAVTNTAGENWVLAVTIISMVLSFGAVLMYLVMRVIFVGQSSEIGLTIFLTALWAAALPTVMNRTFVAVVVVIRDICVCVCVGIPRLYIYLFSLAQHFHNIFLLN